MFLVGQFGLQCQKPQRKDARMPKDYAEYPEDAADHVEHCSKRKRRRRKRLETPQTTQSSRNYCKALRIPEDAADNAELQDTSQTTQDARKYNGLSAQCWN